MFNNISIRDKPPIPNQGVSVEKLRKLKLISMLTLIVKSLNPI
jgi:hypothetical protein